MVVVFFTKNKTTLVAYIDHLSKNRNLFYFGTVICWNMLPNYVQLYKNNQELSNDGIFALFSESRLNVLQLFPNYAGLLSYYVPQREKTVN